PFTSPAIGAATPNPWSPPSWIAAAGVLPGDGAVLGTTRTDGVPDNGPSDLGYHYPTAAAPIPYTLTASPTSVAARSSLSVSFTAPAGSSPQDWVALIKVGDPSQNYYNNLWQFTGGATSGAFTFIAPDQPGNYEFRYLLNNTYTDVRRSATVTVTSSPY